MVFAAYFLPGYLFQPQHAVGGDLFNSLSFNLSYMAQVVPQILLLLYLILRNVGDSRSEKLSDYGLVRLSFASLGRAGVAFAAIYAVLLPLLFGISRLAAYLPPFLADQVHWRLSNTPLLPVILVTCALTGYSEELYFRAYLLTVLQGFGLRPGLAVATSTILFALGHLYEGLAGFLGTMVIGIILSLLFLRRRDLHSIALAHGLYNFTALLLSQVPTPF